MVMESFNYIAIYYQRIHKKETLYWPQLQSVDVDVHNVCVFNLYIFINEFSSHFPDLLSKSQVETFIRENLAEKDYEILYRELHSIPPPADGGSYSISGMQLWLLTSPMRSWTELAWGLYRSHLDTALKKARHEILLDEGEESRLYSISCYFIISGL